MKTISMVFETLFIYFLNININAKQFGTTQISIFKFIKIKHYRITLIMC